MMHYMEKSLRGIKNDEAIQGFRVITRQTLADRNEPAFLAPPNDSLFMAFLRFITLLCVLMNPFYARAASFKDILTTLTSVSCETIFMVTELYYPNTCVPQIGSEMLSKSLAPAMYPWAKARLTMNNNHLFNGNCSKEKRADYYDPKIDFGFCSNLKLVAFRAEALGSVIGGLLMNIFSGNNPWPDIKKDWFIPPSKYIDEYKDISPGKIGFVTDLNLTFMGSIITQNVSVDDGIAAISPVSFFPWKTIIKNDQICVATMSLVGWIPVGCKYMVDPYLYSKYHYFFHNAPITDPNAANSGITFETFQNTCYTDAAYNSKAIISISSPIITCVNQYLTQMLVSKAVTRVDQISDISDNPLARSTSSLYTFQQNMRLIVTTLLTLYVVFIGFDILLGGGSVKKGDMIRYVVKLILVAYFAIGINLTPNLANSTPRDGLTDWILPIVFGGASELAQIVMGLTSGVNGLCYFDPSRYSAGYGYLALWDTLDCRISNYLGLDALADFMSAGSSGNPSFNSLSFSVPPWVFLIIPAAISGNMTLVGLVLAFPFLVLSVASYMVYAFIVCMISITILSVLAPLIIPMVLFEYTRSYFDSWMKLVISFVLQPMIVCVFMTTMFAVFDFGFFGSCKFRSVDVSQNIDGSLHNKKLFVIDNNPGIYSESEKSSCVYSLGYMFNAPFSFVGSTLSAVGDSVTKIDQDSQNANPTDAPTASSVALTDSSGNNQTVGTTASSGQKFDDTKKKHSFLANIKTKEGLFFSYPILHGGIKQFTLTLFTALFALYLMYNLSSQVASFAADMTEGVMIEGAHVKPEFHKEDEEDKGEGESKDTASTGGDSEANDTASTGPRTGDTASTGPRAGDTASTGPMATDNALTTSKPAQDLVVMKGSDSSSSASEKPSDNSQASSKPAQDLVVRKGTESTGSSSEKPSENSKGANGEGGSKQNGPSTGSSEKPISNPSQDFVIKPEKGK